MSGFKEGVTSEEVMADYIDHANKCNFLYRKFKDNGMPISHMLFQLTVEDMITTLAHMWQDGKFDPEELDCPGAMALEVADNIEYSLDWMPSLRWSIEEYLSGLREEKKNAGIKPEGIE